MAKLSLGLQLGYWGALAPGNNHVLLAQEAEKLGYDSVWTALWKKHSLDSLYPQ